MIEVVGEAGIGKSRLLHELRERVMARNVTTLKGRCRAFGDVAPYCPFIEIVRSVLRLPVRGVIDASELVARVREIDASLEPFLPLYLHLLSVHSESHPIPRHLQGEHLEAALVEALATLFIVLSQRTTLVVVLEDWHCADGASRAVLSRMRAIVPAERIVCIVTSRPEPAVFERPSAGSIRMALEPLDYAVVHRNHRGGIARRTRVRSSGSTAVRAHRGQSVLSGAGLSGARRTGCGVAARRRGRCRSGELSLPDTVQAVIRTRLDNLEPQAREVARVASAFGREFEHALLADVVWPDIDLAAAIGRLCASGLTSQTSGDPSARLSFYARPDPGSQLRESPRASAEVASRSDRRRDRETSSRTARRAGGPPRSSLLSRRGVARSRPLRAGAPPIGRAASVSLRTRSTRSTRFWNGCRIFRTTRNDATSRPTCCSSRNARAKRWGSGAASSRSSEDSSRTWRPPARPLDSAETYLREGDLLTLLKRFNGADRALSTALRISRELDDSGLERNILRSVGLLRWHEGRNAEALALTESALAIDRERGDDDAVAGDLVNLANILKSMGEYSVALSKIEEALAMPSLAQNPKKLAYILHNLANVHRGMGDLDATLSCLRRADEISGQLLPIQRSFHLTSIAHIELQQGSIEAAIQTYKDAIELSRRARHAQGLAHSSAHAR